MSKALVKLAIYGSLFVAGAVWLNRAERKQHAAKAIEQARKIHAQLSKAGAPAMVLMEYNHAIALTLNGGCPKVLDAINSANSQRVTVLMMQLRRS